MSLTLKFLTLFGIIVLLSGAIKAEDDVNDVDEVDYDETDSYDAPESESISSRSYGLNVELGGKQYYVGSNRKVRSRLSNSLRRY